MKFLIPVFLLLFGCAEKIEPMPESAKALLADLKGDHCGKDGNTWEWTQVIQSWRQYNEVEFECQKGEWHVESIRIKRPSAAVADRVIRAMGEG